MTHLYDPEASHQGRRAVIQNLKMICKHCLTQIGRDGDNQMQEKKTVRDIRKRVFFLHNSLKNETKCKCKSINNEKFKNVTQSFDLWRTETAKIKKEEKKGQ